MGTGRPRGRPRRLQPPPLPAEVSAPIRAPIAAPAPATPAPQAESEDSYPAPAVPPDWVKGQLLNVRAADPGYLVTLLGEEYDPRQPERCLQFSSSFECQRFVSTWYARQSADPRAA
jgi:hypothetical protein